MPESKLYTELLDFEKKLDATIMRKRLDLQETLNKPVKVSIHNQQGIVNTVNESGRAFFWKLMLDLPLFTTLQTKRTLRVFISNLSHDQETPESDDEEPTLDSGPTPSWTLKVEGRLVDVSILFSEKVAMWRVKTPRSV